MFIEDIENRLAVDKVINHCYLHDSGRVIREILVRLILINVAALDGYLPVLFDGDIVVNVPLDPLGIVVGFQCVVLKFLLPFGTNLFVPVVEFRILDVDNAVGIGVNDRIACLAEFTAEGEQCYLSVDTDRC